MRCYHAPTATGDRATQECDPSTVAAPYGMGLVSSVKPTLYVYVGGSNAINSNAVKRYCLPSINQLFPRRTKYKDQGLVILGFPANDFGS